MSTVYSDACLSYRQITDEQWKAECLIDINTAEKCPRLNERERANLIEEAVAIADKVGYLIKTDAFLRRILCGEEDRKLYSQEKLGDTISFVKKETTKM